MTTDLPKKLTPKAMEAVDLQAQMAALRAELRELKGDVEASRGEITQLRGKLSLARKHVARIERELDAARCKLDIDEQAFADLERFRASEEYARFYETPTPLVSVCVATYNRSKLLMERCLPSLFAQDYPNLEILVVGDGCTDDTAEAIAGIRDPRLRFVNQERPKYPEDPYLRWLVAGARAGNHALSMAKGALMSHLDDDDEYTPDRIGKLVAFLRESRAELVWHPFRRETTADKWETCPAEDFRNGQVTTGSVLYLSWFKRFPWNEETHLYREPGDWNLFRKLKYLGTRIRRHPDTLLVHYKQHTQDT